MVAPAAVLVLAIRTDYRAVAALEVILVMADQVW
jgi:hypothetical protein